MGSLLLAQYSFVENFDNAPDFSNKWVRLQPDTGSGTAITYTPGNLRMQAPATCPGNSIILRSKQAFSGQFRTDIEYNHQGFGRTGVGLWSTTDNSWAAWVMLDTDDTNYLNFWAKGNGATDWKYAGTPYMSRWTTLSFEVTATALNFYADGVLKEVMPFSYPGDSYYVILSAGCVCWKSGANDTSFRRVAVNGNYQETRNVVDDFSIASNPSGAWSFGYTSTLGGTFSRHLTAQPDYVPGVDRWTTPSIDTVLVVAKNKTFSNIATAPSTAFYPPDMLLMHPAFDGTYDVARWTAPASGTYSFFGKFAGLDSVTGVADTDVHILHNSTTSLVNTILHGLGTEQTFSFNLGVLAGDTVDFAVGKGPSGFHQNDATGFKVSVTGGTESPPSCRPPATIFADDVGTGGLAQTLITNQHVGGGQLHADVSIQNQVGLWLGVVYTNAPSGTQITPNLNAGIAGTAASFGLVPPCLGTITCHNPGLAAWNVGYCSAGVIEVDLGFTPLSAAVMLTDAVLPGTPMGTVVGITNQLYTTVPTFKAAANCFVGGNLSCLSSSFLTLARDPVARAQIVTVLKTFGISFSTSDIAKRLLGIPAAMIQAIGYVSAFDIQTALAGHLGIEVVNIHGQ